MAGLFAARAAVKTDPPLFAMAKTLGFVFDRSPKKFNLQLEPLSKLNPEETMTGAETW